MKTKILISILLLSGALVLLYPYISDYINSLSQAQVVENYDNQVERMEDEEMERELARAREYNENLARTIVIDPFTEDMNQELEEDYMNILNINDQMGTIVIPRIGVELPLYHGTEEKELAKGVGHYEGSSLPVGGTDTHTVLSGHRGLPSADLFTRLDEVEEGDLFIINTLGRDITYKVDQIKTVLPDQTEDLSIVPGKDYATLVTCTPYGINTHRLLIRGERTENIPEEERKSMEEEAEKEDRSLENLLAGTAIVLVIAGTALWSLRKPAKRNKKERGDKG